MRILSRALSLATRALFSAALLSIALAPSAHPQQVTLPLWPHTTPEPPQTTAPETYLAKPTDHLSNVTVPTLTVYPPHDHSTGAAVLVFPGGGYQILAWEKEGLDPCHWLNSLDITCILVKYRIPQPIGEPGHFPADPSDLEDAQQAMRLTRAHSAEWHIDPTHIGVMGFSAGANLAVLLCTHPRDTSVESTPAAPDVNTHLSARADFAILAYPAYLAAPPDNKELFPAYIPNEFTPATFLIQAENDAHYGFNALVYYRALMDAHIPAELHYYATGGHGFGMNPPNAPEENWTKLAANWLRSINILPPKPERHPGSGTPPPCSMPQPPPPGHPVNSNTPSNPNLMPNANANPNPNCWSTQP